MRLHTSMFGSKLQVTPFVDRLVDNSFCRT